MNKAELDLLEKVFAREVCGGMYQTKSKLAKKLEDEGYLAPVEREFGSGALKAVCRGYRLTLMGNAAYCMSERCTEKKP